MIGCVCCWSGTSVAAIGTWKDLTPQLIRCRDRSVTVQPVSILPAISTQGNPCSAARNSPRLGQQPAHRRIRPTRQTQRGRDVGQALRIGQILSAERDRDRHGVNTIQPALSRNTQSP